MIEKVSFKPRARILKLLGEQLIGNSKLAIFELVKNAYDADADSVKIVINSPEKKENCSIEVIDFGGTGMTKDTILNIWLEPGAEHRETQRKEGIRTPKYNRLPLGEKGVGRFAVHKLGNKIRINTKSINEPEYIIEVNWEDQLKNKYIDETNVLITEASDKDAVFINGTTGTKILISDLNETFDKKQIQELYQTINSINYPFENKKSGMCHSKFCVSLEVPDHSDWLEGLLDINKDIINESLYQFSFIVTNDGKFSWDYKFNPNTAIKKHFKIETRNNSALDEKLAIHSDGSVIEKPDFYKDLGDIYGEFYVYAFEKDIADLTNFYTYHSEQIKKYLEDNGGVRIYRDGIRVYNYGEKNDDWLNLNRRRINRYSKGINKRLILGAIELSLESTSKLTEKTNREGFVENETYSKLVSVIHGVLDVFENERLKDKERLKNTIESKTNKKEDSVNAPINELRENLQKKQVLDLETSKIIDEIEEKYNQMTDIMITTGVAGLNLSVAFHEMYHEVKSLVREVKNSNDNINIKTYVMRLNELLNAYSRLLKKEKPKAVKLSEVIKNVLEFTSTRYKIHNINCEAPVMDNEKKDIEAFLISNSILGCLANVIDNSIYWIERRWGDQEQNNLKHIYIDITNEFERGPAILIADNGKGFQGMSPKSMVSPFVSNKIGGMGVGLYFVNTVMNMLDGEVLFLEPTEVETKLPNYIDGAVVALVFNKDKLNEVKN